MLQTQTRPMTGTAPTLRAVNLWQAPNGDLFIQVGRQTHHGIEELGPGTGVNLILAVAGAIPMDDELRAWLNFWVEPSSDPFDLPGELIGYYESGGELSLSPHRMGEAARRLFGLPREDQ